MTKKWAPARIEKLGSMVTCELAKPRPMQQAIEFLRDRRDRLVTENYKILAIAAYDGKNPTGERLIVTFDPNGEHQLRPDEPSELIELVRRKLSERGNNGSDGAA